MADGLQEDAVARVRRYEGGSLAEVVEVDVVDRVRRDMEVTDVVELDAVDRVRRDMEVAVCLWEGERWR